MTSNACLEVELLLLGLSRGCLWQELEVHIGGIVKGIWRLYTSGFRSVNTVSYETSLSPTRKG